MTKGSQLENGICPSRTKGTWEAEYMGSARKLGVAKERNPQLDASQGGPACLVDRQLCVQPKLRSEDNTKTNVARTQETPLSSW